MNQFIVKSTWLGSLAAALVLTACGGGGSGGGSSFTPPVINETPVAITVDNQNAVAQTADESISGTAGGGGGVLGVVVDGDGSSFSAFDFATTRLLDSVKRGGVASADLPAGVVVELPNEPCDTSGSETITFDIADPESGMLIAGDSASITANNCVDAFGNTTNGRFSLSIDSGSIVFDCLVDCPDVTISVDFNNFRETENGGLTTTMHGDMTMAASETGGTATISGTSLFLIEGSDAVHLTNFDVSSETVGVTTSTTVNMTIAGTLIDGSITIATTSPVLQDELELHPHGGTVVVTGNAGATLTIDYLDPPTHVQLTLDTDGPGGVAAEAPVIVAWADM